MELFHIPMREIRERFTRSEIVLLGWRSQEQSYHLKKKTDAPPPVMKKRKYGEGDIGPDQAPEHFFNTDGEIDLSKVTGEEARAYFQNVLGIPLPVMGGAARVKEGLE